MTSRINGALVALGGAIVAGVVQAEGASVIPPQYKHFAIVGIGAGPQYLGSDDDVWAVAPAGRFSFEKVTVELTANYLSLDLFPDSNWHVGPAGILRFGRGDVEDAEVAALPDIGMSLDLGVQIDYAFPHTNPRNRWRVGGSVLQDTSGAHDGYVATANIRHWLPVGKYGALGLSFATSWASEDYMDRYFSVDHTGAALSGLPSYSAGAGWRDVRLTAIFIQPISEEWAIGAGVLYSRLLSEASDSPVVRSRDQVYAGIGVARAW